MIKKVVDQVFDMERALYGSNDILVKDCTFDGPEDGKSALKECTNVQVKHSFFNLRYPFWHDQGLKISDCEMTDSTVESEYFMMRSSQIRFDRVKMVGKYSFQYITDSSFKNCVFDTKDAFWHAKNIVVENSIVKGEYLAWYSENVTFLNCRIIGTQPLCYCKNLKLINCEMIETDLAFERSEVEASITTPVLSVKNPIKGHIYLPEVGEIIRDIDEAKGEVIREEIL